MLFCNRSHRLVSTLPQVSAILSSPVVGLYGLLRQLSASLGWRRQRHSSLSGLLWPRAAKPVTWFSKKCALWVWNATMPSHRQSPHFCFRLPSLWLAALPSSVETSGTSLAWEFWKPASWKRSTATAGFHRLPSRWHAASCGHRSSRSTQHFRSARTIECASILGRGPCSLGSATRHRSLVRLVGRSEIVISASVAERPSDGCCRVAATVVTRTDRLCRPVVASRWSQFSQRLSTARTTEVCRRNQSSHARREPNDHQRQWREIHRRDSSLLCEYHEWTTTVSSSSNSMQLLEQIRSWSRDYATMVFFEFVFSCGICLAWFRSNTNMHLTSKTLLNCNTFRPWIFEDLRRSLKTLDGSIVATSSLMTSLPRSVLIVWVATVYRRVFFTGIDVVS